MTYTVRLRVETPCFSGGSEAAVKPCVRASSLRGVLRFWLRALTGHRFRHLDSAIFGERKRPSAVRLFVGSHHFTPQQPKGFPPEVVYLAYGLMRRKFIPPGTEIPVHIDFVSGLDVGKRRLFFLSLCGLVFFGGIGARTRRGFGAISVVDFEPKDEASEVLEWTRVKADGVSVAAERIILEAAALVDGPEEEMLPPVSFASDGAEVYISKQPYPTPGDAHRRLGTLMRTFRDYRASRIASRDHDLVYHFATTGEIDNVPLRTVFGMPHHYFLRNLGGGTSMMVTFTPGATARGITRRASPLLLSVIPTEDGATICVILMRGLFLPRSVPILVESQKKTQKTTEHLPRKTIGRHPSWQAAITFVDNLFRTGEFSSLNLPKEKI